MHERTYSFSSHYTWRPPQSPSLASQPASEYVWRERDGEEDPEKAPPTIQEVVNQQKTYYDQLNFIHGYHFATIVFAVVVSSSALQIVYHIKCRLLQLLAARWCYSLANLLSRVTGGASANDDHSGMGCSSKSMWMEMDRAMKEKVMPEWSLWIDTLLSGWLVVWWICYQGTGPLFISFA